MYALYIRGVSKGNINRGGEVIKDEVENSSFRLGTANNGSLGIPHGCNCKNNGPYIVRHYLAIYIYSIYRHAPAVADDKSDIATRDNFFSSHPRSGRTVQSPTAGGTNGGRRGVCASTVCSGQIDRFVKEPVSAMEHWRPTAVLHPSPARLTTGIYEKETRSVLSSQPVHLESCRRAAPSRRCRRHVIWNAPR
ncbi:hypothetical protein ALC62_09137 [Cyphomyrmex costatus]|uniref:Uncharacterized protein n=1 Tax=Cyphomyrmex costatus TaxID=456900 RepID=A0A195CH71_9HYME|nr:hypothetical protein ALC62_09137 [Cyphomyrmex costatus]